MVVATLQASQGQDQRHHGIDNSCPYPSFWYTVMWNNNTLIGIHNSTNKKLAYGKLNSTGRTI